MAPAADVVPVLKDADQEQPVPSAWRATLTEVVRLLAAGDYALKGRPAEVEAVDERTAEQMRGYVEDYGERLTELPEASWDTSVCQWMETYWAVLVDLWTEGEGASDLVLSLRIFEADAGFRYRVQTLYVP